MSSPAKSPSRTKGVPPEDAKKPCLPLSATEIVCTTNTPFSSTSMKLNIPDKKVKLSATLPILSKKLSKNSTNGNTHEHTRSRSDHSSAAASEALRKSVNVASEKLKIAIAKSMPRPLPKAKEQIHKPPPTKRIEREERKPVSDNESPPTPVKPLTDADLRQIAIERANRSVKKQRMREQAEKEAAALERRLRAEQIEHKQRQRDRYRAEVYAVNAILKKMEMQRFDELRQERGNDRSFLDNCSSEDDDISVEDNDASSSDMADSEYSERPTGTTTTTKPQKRVESKTTPNTKQKASLKGGRDVNRVRSGDEVSKDVSKDVSTLHSVKEPVQSRGSKPPASSRKLHLSSSSSPSSSSAELQTPTSSAEGTNRAGGEAGGGTQTQSETEGLLLQQKYQCPPDYLPTTAPASTSESEICNFSFGV